MTIKTRWAELFPDEFMQKLEERPLVYLPLGICEPHGYISALGLDTFKADYLCDESARRFGGIVAPTLAYHIHEAGYHAPWLAEVLGEQRSLMTGMPPHVMLYFFLYQLRCFYNAGFSTAIIISGHSGGNQHDFRLAAAIFEQFTGMKVHVYADPELVDGLYEGDHAGKYEISQLLYLRPDTIDLAAIDKMNEPGSLGRFAQGPDAAAASALLGSEIIEACMAYIGQLVRETPALTTSGPLKMMDYPQVEKLYQQLLARKTEWCTLTKRTSQSPAPPGSRWEVYEEVKIPDQH